MMKNLFILDIRPNSRKKILFYNDLGEDEIELNNLEYFIISRNRIQKIRKIRNLFRFR